MDTHRRTVTKAISYQLVGLVVMTVLGTIFTGSASAGGALAIISGTAGTLSYVLHERLWGLVRWGQLSVSLVDGSKPECLQALSHEQPHWQPRSAIPE